MFITVAVSDGTECLFNPDCMVNVLLAAVKKHSDIPKQGTRIQTEGVNKLEYGLFAWVQLPGQFCSHDPAPCRLLKRENCM